MGAAALFSNIDSKANTAVGSGALFQNDQTGTAMAGGNTAVGFDALFSNIDGNSNTAVGDSALTNNTFGSFNQALGVSALHNNTTGTGNIAIGDNAMPNNVNGSADNVVGGLCGTNIVAGVGNVYIGRDVDGPADESNSFRTRAIGSTPQVSGINVTINTISTPGTSGFVRLGHDASSRRYKEDIKPMDKASETLFALKPVTFRAKENIDPAHVKQYGLIAEDVATVDSDLVVYDSEGKPEALRRDSINAMLLNEFLKEHRKVEEQQTAIAALKSELQMVKAEQQRNIQTLTARLEQQASQIQSVSAQLAAASPSRSIADSR